MKKGQIIEGIVKKVEFPQKGIVETPEGRVVVKQTLPGERVRLMVTKKRGGKAEGRVLEILEPSPLATAKEVCPHFGVCGGCAYQSLSYEAQLALKLEQLQELLKDVLPAGMLTQIKPSPSPLAYRNKMEFSFGDERKDGPLALGMHRRGSFYDVVTVDGCRIVDEDFRTILEGTLKFFEPGPYTFYHKMSHEGYLRHLLVRKAAKTEEILVDLVTTSQIDGRAEERLLADYRDMLLGLPVKGRFAGILHTVNNSLADAVCNDRTEILYGQDHFYEELLGLRFKITPFSFFQTNSLGAEVLYQTAREYIGETDGCRIFDLYSGTGTIAQLMAPVAKEVIGVEIVEEAVEAARENAKQNGLLNCRFVAGDVLKVLDTVEEKPDLIVLDPPREGIHPKALPKIIEYGVERMVYISCKPTSLARDLQVLEAAGYMPVRACGVDMFPWTSGIETVVLLARQKTDSIA